MPLPAAAMPSTTGNVEAQGPGEETSFSFPNVATASRESHAVSTDGAGGSDEGYSGWARRVITAASEGRFGRTLRIGAWAKKPISSAETRDKGASAGLWPPWDPSHSAPRTAASGPQQQRSLAAQYRQEMMDLVRDAPESAYELSLRDLVELPRTENGRVGQSCGSTGKAGQQEPGIAREEEKAEMKRPKKKKDDPGKEPWRFWRSRSQRTGALVWNKAFFVPVLVGLSGWRKRVTDTTSTSTGRMSPKAVVHDEVKCESGREEKAGGDKGWRRSRSKDRWMIGKSGSGRSDISSCSTGSQSRRRKSAGCSIWL